MSHEQIIHLQFLLLIAIIIFVSKMAGHLSKRYLKQPVVFGEILAGLIIGPSLLNIFGWPIFMPPDPEYRAFLHHGVNTLAGFGVLLLMFIAGIETNLDQMRSVGKVAFWTAIAGVVFPLGLGTLTARLFGLGLAESIFIGAVLTATSVSISAQTLMELGRFKSKEGMTILGAAVIDDILGIIVLSFVIAFNGAPHGTGTHFAKLSDTMATGLGALTGIHAPAVLSVMMVVLLMAIFFAVAIWIASRGFGPLLAVVDRMHASYAVPAFALLLMLLFAVGAEYFGQVAAITGAYIVGIFVARTRFHEKILHAIQPFTYALFVPVFFMSIGLGADIHKMQGGWLFTFVIIAVAIITKVFGCGLGALLTGFTRQEATRVGAGMVSRGEVGLIVAQVGLASMVISEAEYAPLVLMVLATTVVTPLLLRLAFPRVKEAAARAEVYESVVTVETGEEEERI
jgi:Kef-type K+ transport system membrane component KefB